MNRQQRRAAARGPGARHQPGTTAGTGIAADVGEIVRLYLAGQRDAAEKAARALLKQHPNEATSLHLLSLMLMERGQLGEAFATASHALDVGGPQSELLATLGKIVAIQGDTAAAIARFDHSLALLEDPAIRALRDRAAAELAAEHRTRETLQQSGGATAGDGAMLARVAQRYDHIVTALGDQPGGVMHDDPVLHRTTFEVMLSMIDPATTGPLVLQDLGCGYGALFDLIADQPWFARGSYCGLDISAEMIEAARRRIRDPRASFRQAAALTGDGDYTIVAGSYNFCLHPERAEWIAYIQGSLRNVAAHSRKGFAFNMLQPAASRGDPNLIYQEPGPMQAFCRDELGGRVELRDDYSPREWTLIVHRN